MNDEQRRQELADFLRTRRTRLTPEQVGLLPGGRRRTPGLRREEVAQLANVGVSWYTLLEQGHAIHPSYAVLQSIAGALQLTSVEQHHLFVLAGLQPPIETPAPYEQVSPTLRLVLDELNPMPAYIMGHRWDYLAWNEAAERALLLGDALPPHERNAVWRMFVDPRSRELYHWEQVAQKILAEFRAESVPFADQEWFKRLVADLQRVSPEFRDWWPRHNVRGRVDAQKELNHPLVGHLTFEITTMQLAAQPELKLMIYTPAPATDTRDKLQRLLEQELTANAVS